MPEIDTIRTSDHSLIKQRLTRFPGTYSIEEMMLALGGQLSNFLICAPENFQVTSTEFEPDQKFFRCTYETIA